MKRLAMVLMTMGTLGLGGCASNDEPGIFKANKPLDKMSNEEWCGFYANYLKDRTISPKNRDEDLARMRARGCPMQG